MSDTTISPGTPREALLRLLLVDDHTVVREGHPPEGVKWGPEGFAELDRDPAAGERSAALLAAPLDATIKGLPARAVGRPPQYASNASSS